MFANKIAQALAWVVLLILGTITNGIVFLVIYWVTVFIFFQVVTRLGEFRINKRLVFGGLLEEISIFITSAFVPFWPFWPNWSALFQEIRYGYRRLESY